MITACVVVIKPEPASTMTSICLQKSDFGTLEGFYVVFIVKPDNEDCEGYLEFSDILPPHQITETAKAITVEIKGTLPSQYYFQSHTSIVAL